MHVALAEAHAGKEAGLVVKVLSNHGCLVKVLSDISSEEFMVPSETLLFITCVFGYTVRVLNFASNTVTTLAGSTTSASADGFAWLPSSLSISVESALEAWIVRLM